MASATPGAGVLAADSGLGRLAIFDLDGTLLTGDTDEYWLRFVLAQDGEGTDALRAQSDDVQRRYARGQATAEEFCFFYLALLRGKTADDLKPLYDRFFETIVAPNLPPRAFELVAEEKARADLVVMSTATNGFLSTPIGRHLGFDHVIATDPETDTEGRFTGGCVGLPNMRANKIPRLAAWLAARGLSLSSFRESCFYSDSRNDLPLLQAVTHPVAVDPDPELESRATRDGWPILRFHAR